MSFLDFFNVFTKMASDPKFAEDFSPSVKISEVLDVIEEKYFGPVNIDENFLVELKSVLKNKVGSTC